MKPTSDRHARAVALVCLLAGGCAPPPSESDPDDEPGDYETTFLIELNHAARDMATFTWDAAFQQILGQGVQQTWDEYQASLP